MVGAAARHFQHCADDPDGVAGGLADGVHHFPALDGTLVTVMTAAFSKMSFSIWRRAFSLRSSRRPFTGDLLHRGACPPVVEQIAADSEFLRELGHRLSGGQQFHSLAFKLGGVSYTYFHGSFWRLLVQ